MTRVFRFGDNAINVEHIQAVMPVPDADPKDQNTKDRWAVLIVLRDGLQIRVIQNTEEVCRTACIGIANLLQGKDNKPKIFTL